MIKKLGLLFIAILVILLIAIMLKKDQVEKIIKNNPVLYHYVRKTLDSFSSSENNSDAIDSQKEITTEVSISVNANKNIGSFDNFYNGIGMGTFNDGLMQAHNYQFIKLVGEMNKKQRFMNYVNTKCIFLDEPKRGRRDYGAHVYRKDESGKVTYYWDIVDEVLDRILANGLKPIISLTFIPKDLASDPKRKNPWNRGIVSPPQNYHEWRDLIYETVKHLKERYGTNEIQNWYFEVWNEPDFFKFFWIPHPNRKRYPQKGDYEEYFKLYDYAVDGALAADSNIKIGGPAIAGDVNLFLKEFLKHCFSGTNYATGRVGTQVDFISRHLYGWIDKGLVSDYKAFVDVIKTFVKSDFDELEILITETGPSTKPKPWLNNRYVAAWIVKEVDAILNLSDKYGAEYLPDIMCFWTHPVSKNFGKEFSLATALGDKHFPSAEALIKRPAFNGFEAISLLGTDRLEIKGTRYGDPIHGIATKGYDGSIKIVLYHLIEGDTYNNRIKTYTVNLTITACPKSEYTLETYVVNETHSNAYTLWQKMGSPNYPDSEKLHTLQSKDDLELLEPISKIKLENGIFKKQISIQNNSIIFLRLHQFDDTLPPNKPRDLYARLNNAARSVSLNWLPPKRSMDGDRAESYLIYRNGVLIASQFAQQFNDRDILDNSRYVYAVYAVDDAGNVSQQSVERVIVIPKDEKEPGVTHIITSDEHTLVVYFDEALDEISATNVENYSISNNIEIKKAAYNENMQAVILTTSRHDLHDFYELKINKIEDRAQVPNNLFQKKYEYKYEISFVDRFDYNSLSDYAWTHLKGPLKQCRRYYDRVNNRMMVLTGDDNKLSFSHRLSETDTGHFSLNFLPVKKYPNGGAIEIYLKQDDNNYYKILNTDGYGPGKIEKVVDGNVVDSTAFVGEYSQEQPFIVHVNFLPISFTVQAFHERLSLKKFHHPILVKTFEVELTQQDAYFDDIEFRGQ